MSSNFPAEISLANFPRNMGMSRASFSTATICPALCRSSSVSVPSPGPTSNTASSGARRAASAIFCKMRGSRRKCWASDFFLCMVQIPRIRTRILPTRIAGTPTLFVVFVRLFVGSCYAFFCFQMLLIYVKDKLRREIDLPRAEEGARARVGEEYFLFGAGERDIKKPPLFFPRALVKFICGEFFMREQSFF